MAKFNRFFLLFICFALGINFRTQCFAHSFWIDTDLSHHPDAAVSLASLRALDPEIRSLIAGVSTVGLEPRRQAGFIDRIINPYLSSTVLSVYAGVGPERVNSPRIASEVLLTFPGFSLKDLVDHKTRSRECFACSRYIQSFGNGESFVLAENALVNHLSLSAPDSVVIVALGPLNNIANALQSAPALADRIHKVVFLKDSVKANQASPSPSQSYNIGVNVEAFLQVARLIGEKLHILMGKELAYPLSLPLHFKVGKDLFSVTEGERVKSSLHSHLKNFFIDASDENSKFAQPTGLALTYGLHADRYETRSRTQGVWFKDERQKNAYYSNRIREFFRINESVSTLPIKTVAISHIDQVTAHFHQLVVSSLGPGGCSHFF